MTRKTKTPEKRLAPRHTEVDRTTSQYYEGYESPAASIGDCPYKQNDPRRTGWMTGWLDKQSDTKFGALFANYNLPLMGIPLE